MERKQEIRKLSDRTHSRVIVETNFLTELPFKELREGDQFNDITSVDLRHSGEQPLIIDQDLGKYLPKVENIKLRGKIIVRGTMFNTIKIRAFSIYNNPLLDIEDNQIIPLLRLHSPFKILNICDYDTFPRLDRHIEDIEAENLQIFDCDFGQPGLIDFASKISIDHLTLHRINSLDDLVKYVEVDHLRSMDVWGSTIDRLPQEVINRLIRYRLTNDPEEELLFGIQESNLPDCIDRSSIGVITGKYARISKDEMMTETRLRLDHYIKYHHEPENFESLPECKELNDYIFTTFN